MFEKIQQPQLASFSSATIPCPKQHKKTNSPANLQHRILQQTFFSTNVDMSTKIILAFLHYLEH